MSEQRAELPELVISRQSPPQYPGGEAAERLGAEVCASCKKPRDPVYPIRGIFWPTTSSLWFCRWNCYRLYRQPWKVNGE